MVESTRPSLYAEKTFSLIVGSDGVNNLFELDEVDTSLTLDLVGESADESIFGTYSGANDYIAGFDGNDTLVGDVNSVVAHSSSDAINVGTVSTNVENTITGGSDVVSGGQSNNIFVGDVNFVDTTAGAVSAGYTVSSFAYARNMIVGGNDFMIGGEGANIVVGDINDVYTYASSYSVAPNGGLVRSFGGAETTIDCGIDVINGGVGDETLIGDVGSASTDSNIISPRAGALAKNIVNCGNDTLIGGPGNDTLVGDVRAITDSGSGITTVNGGADRFVFTQADVNSIAAETDTIEDFRMSDGDVLGLKDILSGYDAANEATDPITNYLKVVPNGSNAILEIDKDGGGVFGVSADHVIQVNGGDAHFTDGYSDYLNQQDQIIDNLITVKGSLVID